MKSVQIRDCPAGSFRCSAVGDRALGAANRLRRDQQIEDGLRRRKLKEVRRRLEGLITHWMGFSGATALEIERGSLAAYRRSGPIAQDVDGTSAHNHDSANNFRNSEWFVGQ